MADTLRALDAVYRHERDAAIAELRAVVARQAQTIAALESLVASKDNIIAAQADDIERLHMDVMWHADACADAYASRARLD